MISSNTKSKTSKRNVEDFFENQHYDDDDLPDYMKHALVKFRNGGRAGFNVIIDNVHESRPIILISADEAGEEENKYNIMYRIPGEFRFEEPIVLNGKTIITYAKNGNGHHIFSGGRRKSRSKKSRKSRKSRKRR